MLRFCLILSYLNDKIVFMEKRCSRCKLMKPFLEFSKSKDRPFGLHLYCKSCQKADRLLNKERDRLTAKSSRERNKEKIAIKKKEYYEENKEKITLYKKEYYLNHKEELSKESKIYYQENKDIIKQRSNDYYANNQEKFENNKKQRSDVQRQYVKNNKEKVNSRHRKRRNKIANSGLCVRHPNEPALTKGKCSECVVMLGIKTLIGRTFKEIGSKKSNRTEQILGCSLDS